jgi:hypothetical protein
LTLIPDPSTHITLLALTYVHEPFKALWAYEAFIVLGLLADG